MYVHNLLEQLAPLVKEYEDKQKKRMDTGFNVFYLISDYYYRETFHGDILYALLSPHEKHGEGSLFVDLFIDMINLDEEVKKYYSTVTVKREYGTNDGEEMGRIDLLIIGEKNHCIVIENKLNDAGDTCHQLPKYRNDLEKKGYDIDVFVYIPRNPDKWPDTSDWSEEEIESINSKLVVIPAYKNGQTNLIENWLTPSTEKAKNEDAKFIIRQYITLLNNLTIDIMDNKPIIDILFKDDSSIDATLAIMDNYNAICEKVKEDFIKDLSKKVNEIGTMNDSLEIILGNGWTYCIGSYPRYYRYVKCEKMLPTTIDRYWNHVGEGPFGWDYFDEKKGWCYWNKPSTLRAMRNGEFASFIINELMEIKRRIAEINM